MIRWLPRIALMHACTMVGEDGEGNGLVLQFAWLGLVVEFLVAIEAGR
jgi:hypothetical protein